MEDVEELLSHSYRQLVDDGWLLSLTTTSGGMFLVFDHPLSSRFDLGLGKDESKARDRAERFLQHKEFNVIHNRPAVLANAEFLGKFREVTGAMKCPPRISAAIARAMGVHRLLTEDEADWLEEAGPAWAQELAGS